MMCKIRIFFYITLFLLLPSRVFSQGGGEDVHPEEFQDAVALFEQGNYTAATPLFEKLIGLDPENAMLNYYYGACLAEQDIFTDSTNQYLLKAVSGNTPNKIFYYVGKYFQSRELWNSAIKYYSRFNDTGEEKDKTEVRIDTLINYCKNKLNPQPVDPVNGIVQIQTLIPETDTVSTNQNLQEKEDKPVEHIQAGNNTAVIAKLEPINFRVNSEIIYLETGQFKNKEALAFFREGYEAEIRLGKLMAKSDSLRRMLNQRGANRNLISERILLLEQETYTLKSKSDENIGKARNLEQLYWDQASQDEILQFQTDTEKLLDQIASAGKEEVEPEETPMQEAVPQIFIIEEPEQKPVTDEDDKDEIIFKIQIGAYSRNLPVYVERLYKKLSLIRKIDNYTDDRGVTVYTTGNLTNFEDAVKMQAQVRQEGVQDAFVVAYLNGNRITIAEAKKILNIR